MFIIIFIDFQAIGTTPIVLEGIKSLNLHSITYGINVGGNSLVISSLANIIALRMSKDKEI